jgi:hypothetical protein
VKKRVFEDSFTNVIIAQSIRDWEPVGFFFKTPGATKHVYNYCSTHRYAVLSLKTESITVALMKLQCESFGQFPNQ